MTMKMHVMAINGNCWYTLCFIVSSSYVIL